MFGVVLDFAERYADSNDDFIKEWNCVASYKQRVTEQTKRVTEAESRLGHAEQVG